LIDHPETAHEGGCLCGGVRYRVQGDPVAVSICHCTNCQRNSGGAFSVNVIFPKEAVTMNGSPATYIDTGDTGADVVRVFCGVRGTPLESRSIMSSVAHTVIKAGSFDDPSGFVPDSEVYCDSSLPWVTLSSDRTCFSKLAEF